MSHARQILIGMEEIEKYTGLNANLLRFLIQNCRFPARKTSVEGARGTWISNVSAIDEWSLAYARSGSAVKQEIDDI